MTTQYNRKIKDNDTLRKEIDHLKIVSKQSTDTITKLKMNLKEADNELNSLSEKHKLAYEQRFVILHEKN